MEENLEAHYLQRIAEIVAGSERRVAHLAMEVIRLKADKAELELALERLTSTASNGLQDTDETMTTRRSP